MATKTKKKPKTKTPSALAQAQAEMDVKYKPQLDAAQGLLGEAADQYKSDIETAKNNSAAIQAFAKSQEAPTIDRYKTAADSVARDEANTATALEGVGPSADIFRRAITGTQGTTRSQQTGAGTRASQALADRQTSAMAGGVAAQNQARTDYRKTKTGLTNQIQSLIGQQGADTIARFGQIAEQNAANQTDIDVAKIAADARRDVAGAGATTAANKLKGAAAEKEQKRVTGIRKATGDMKQAVIDIAGKWDTLAGRVGRRKNPAFDAKKPVTGENLPYLNPNGKPVLEKEHGAEVRMTPQAIRDELTQGENAVEPGLLHVALLVRAGKPLDAAAIRYIKANQDWRVPREWLPKAMTPKHLPDRYGGAGRGADTT